MRLSCRRVLAGDPADEPGRLGGVVSAVGAQRAAPGQRQPGREGDPQLRAGGQGRPGRAGPVGVIDLAVPHPGAGRRRGDGRGQVEVLDSRRLGGAWTWIRWGIGCDRRRTRQVAAGRRYDSWRSSECCSRGRPARPRTGLELAATRGWPSGWRSRARRADRRSAYRAIDFLLDAFPGVRCRSVRLKSRTSSRPPGLDIIFSGHDVNVSRNRDRRH